MNTALLALLSRSASMVIIRTSYIDGAICILVYVHMSLPHNTANLVIDDVTLTTKIHGCQLYTIMNSPVEIFTKSFLRVACCGILSFKLRRRTKFCISQLTCLPQRKLKDKLKKVKKVETRPKYRLP